MEDRTEDGLPTSWMFGRQLIETGYRLDLDEEDPVEGLVSARVDSTGVEAVGNQFGNLSQSFDATPWRGKRVRFRAAVKTADRTENGRAQLWFRVDRKSSGTQPKMGFFDNMQDRPIVDDAWQHYEIVGDIADDSQRIIVGMLVLGKCVAWMDEVSLEVVDKTVKVTGGGIGGMASSPPQPFFTWWLVLPVVALSLFSLGYAGNRWFHRMAFRFSLAYWVLYCFPTLLQTALSIFIPMRVARWSSLYETQVVDPVVRWTAANILRVEGQLVSAFQNGSGDTTFSHVQVLVCFVLASVVAGLWSLADWRKTDHAWLRDLLRSYLRYVLAITMLGYGLAKLGLLFNQFPAPDAGRLGRSLGESSPMGLLWTFMGASRGYTFFAGAGETVAALLLIWRRTTLLGAMVAFGVMLNVMVLNFCYDVPVKLYSFHLVVMALFICLPDCPRLANLLFWHRAVGPVSLLPPYTGRVTIWIQRSIKAFLIVVAIGIPVVMHTIGEWKSARPFSALGDWKVMEILVDGQSGSSPLAESLGGRTLTLARTFPPATDRAQIAATITISAEVGQSVSVPATIHRDKMILNGVGLERLTSGELNWQIVGQEMELSNQVDGKEIRIRLQRLPEESLLMNRGFRWVNERPFNR